MVFRFKDFRYSEGKQIKNSELIFIYIEEIIFNFVVFYNLVLKEYHEENLEDQYKKCKTIRNTISAKGRQNKEGVEEDKEEGLLLDSGK